MRADESETGRPEVSTEGRAGGRKEEGAQEEEDCDGGVGTPRSPKGAESE